MNAGSAADVMQYAWPGGMEEEVVRCILKQALEGPEVCSFRLFLPIYLTLPHTSCPVVAIAYQWVYPQGC
jgi:hypothetical protein